MEPAEMLKALGDPFPRNALKQRTGGGGKSFTYIETHTVIHRLNSVAGAWDFRMVNVEWRSDLLIVQGELTIPGLGTRSGFGVQKVAANAGEDLVKGASSDALKKCATLFGVALDLYGPDYEATSAPMRPQTAQVDPQQTQAPTQDSVVMKKLHAVAKKAGITHEQLHGWAVSKGAASLKDVPEESLNTMTKRINDNANAAADYFQQFSPQPLEIDGMDELNAAADQVQAAAKARR